jgi:pimeloyl-ACP methyl ester carboxylesterase
LRRGFQNLAILALILSVRSGSMPVGAEGLDASRTAAMPLAMTPSAGSVASRWPAPAAGAFRFKPLGLSSLRPSIVGRIPVVLVHGLWGSPAMWEPMVKALEADPRASGRFQFLTFGYSGGGSIPHAAFLLRRDLRALRDRLDPDKSDPSWDRMILIGHSMGGLLCKMMAQDSGTRLLHLITDRPIEELAGPAGALEQLKGELIFEPLPEVRRVIFIATPHRGSPLDIEPVRAIAARLVRPSDGSQRAHTTLLASNDPVAFHPAFRAGLPTSIDELAWEHPLLMAIDGLPIDPRVERHSIIADRRTPPWTDGGDGLVPYASAHHPGATSELMVSAGHLCLENPEVIGEVARILEGHAAHGRPTRRGPEAVGRYRGSRTQPRETQAQRLCQQSLIFRRVSHE